MRRRSKNASRLRAVRRKGRLLQTSGYAGFALAPPGREAATARESSDKKIQEQGMRKIIETVGTVVTVVIAVAFT